MSSTNNTPNNAGSRTKASPFHVRLGTLGVLPSDEVREKAKLKRKAKKKHMRRGR